MSTPYAQRLAELIYDALQRQPIERSSRLLGIGPRDFDPTTVTGELMVEASQFLLDTGKVFLPPPSGAIKLVAIKDGRRSRLNYPDHLLGWQYIGQLDPQGKPLNAPAWVKEKIRRGPDGQVALKTSLSICPKTLMVGDWVVQDGTGIYEARPRIFSLPAAAIARWYQQE